VVDNEYDGLSDVDPISSRGTLTDVPIALPYGRNEPVCSQIIFKPALKYMDLLLIRGRF
jgi:hypothetical protein